MRISNQLKQVVLDNVQLGYHSPTWLKADSDDQSRWPQSMPSEYALCIQNDEENHWNRQIIHNFQNWVDFVSERNGTIDFVEFALKWFFTEDILYYQLAFDNDGTYMLSYFNEDRDTRMKMKTGKWFQTYYGRDDPSLVRKFASEWNEMVLKCKDIYSQYSVNVLTQPDAIVERYKSWHRTDLSSCCSYGESQYSTGGEHPCKVYGGESDVHLAVIQDSSGEDFARTLIFNKKYIRIYPTGRSHESSVARGVLMKHGIASEQGNLGGAKLNFIKHGDVGMEEFVVCPYLDGCASLVSIGTRTADDPSQQCLDVHDRDVMYPTIDTQSGNMHERACFDSRTMYIFGDAYDYTCSNCEDGFNDYHDGAIHPMAGGTYCSEECATESGYVLAYTSSNDMEWEHEDEAHLNESNGNYYTERGLSLCGLVINNHGEVHPMDDCVFTESQGWLLSVDCLFVNTPQEYQDTPDNLRPVWMLATGEVGTGTLDSFLLDTGQHRSLVEQNIGEA